ncbi:hypothetical protein Sjap_002433 [Stephania japonica]|uniref:Uncharacterized protein n=1 Tax=Stephania japonica TaxID=461633 RepID=A0AAP0KNG6_9MAGN
MLSGLSSLNIQTSNQVNSAEVRQGGMPTWTNKKSQQGNSGYGGRNYNVRSRGGRNNRGRGRYQTNNRPTCQICNKNGHTAGVCYYRADMSYDGAQSFNGQGNQYKNTSVHGQGNQSMREKKLSQEWTLREAKFSCLSSLSCSFMFLNMCYRFGPKTRGTRLKETLKGEVLLSQTLSEVGRHQLDHDETPNKHPSAGGHHRDTSRPNKWVRGDAYKTGHIGDEEGLSRCGKSCILGWENHLRPDIKKGATYSKEEDKYHY